MNEKKMQTFKEIYIETKLLTQKNKILKVRGKNESYFIKLRKIESAR